jgi:hypothetical protein
MYQDTFFLFFIFYFFLYVCKVCARRLETETYIQKQNQTNLTLVTYLLIELLTDTALSRFIRATCTNWYNMILGTDALQHRESIGRFYCLARTV